MCHFHQKSIITRYLTKKPKLQASKDLKRISSFLTRVEESRFKFLLDCWHKKYEDFLNEKSLNISTKKETFTHPKLRSAYRSLKTNLPYLFTCKNYSKLDIPNTTNSLEGGVFSPMKKLINIHGGLNKSLKLKMVDDYLVNYKEK